MSRRHPAAQQKLVPTHGATWNTTDEPVQVRGLFFPISLIKRRSIDVFNGFESLENDWCSAEKNWMGIKKAEIRDSHRLPA